MNRQNGPNMPKLFRKALPVHFFDEPAAGDSVIVTDTCVPVHFRDEPAMIRHDPAVVGMIRRRFPSKYAASRLSVGSPDHAGSFFPMNRRRTITLADGTDDEEEGRL